MSIRATRATEAGGRRRRGGSRSAEQMARGLGWFSVGLGLAQIVAPGALSRLIGVDDDRRARRAMRTVGLREIGSGIALLAQPRAARWLWARVVGDVMDLALLGAARRSKAAERRRVGGALGLVAGVTLIDAVTAQRASQAEGSHRRTVKSITIKRSPAEVYAFWRDLENLPRFMAHLESVEVTGPTRSRWTALAPAGLKVSWDAEITDDQPNERIGWRSLEGAHVDTFGTVSFLEAPGVGGTEVRVDLRYDAPAGALGASVAKLFRREPGQEVASDLRRLKQVLETGQVIHSDATLSRGLHPARPSASAPPFDVQQVLEPAPLDGGTFHAEHGPTEEMR